MYLNRLVFVIYTLSYSTRTNLFFQKFHFFFVTPNISLYLLVMFFSSMRSPASLFLVLTRIYFVSPINHGLFLFSVVNDSKDPDQGRRGLTLLRINKYTLTVHSTIKQDEVANIRPYTIVIQ